MAIILGLSSSLWEPIASFLKFEDLLNLISIGCPQLTTAVTRNTRSIVWQQAGPFLDLDSFLDTCERIASPIHGRSILNQLRIEPLIARIAVKLPTKPLSFPPQLTELSLRFHGAIALVLPLKLSELLPGLCSLSLEDTCPVNFAIEDLDLPERLHSLTLLPVSFKYPSIDVSMIYLLPRTLESLSIHCDWPDFQDHHLLAFAWPPGLTALEIANGSYELFLESLPRSVTHLDLSSCDLLSTGFPSNSATLDFPWRRFFPRLHSLILPNDNDPLEFSSTRLLRTLVLDDALGASKVDYFMASGFWGKVPSLLHLQTPEGRATERYPPFTSLTLPRFFFQKLSQDFWLEELGALSPYLQGADFGPLCVVPPSLTPLMKATRSFAITSTDDGLDALKLYSFSPAVTALRHTTKIRISNIPPTLTRLESFGIVESCDSDGFLDGETFPESLTFLDLISGNHHPKLYKMLPKALSVLKIAIKSCQEWSLIAERLVNLKELRVIIEPTWTCTSPLAPITSTQLEKLNIMTKGEWQRPWDTPKLREFFVQPSILPASLRTLDLFEWSEVNDTTWHASIMALLPRNLTSLTINSMQWEDSPVSYPEARSMSAEDLIKCLPSGLKYLFLGAPPAGPHPGPQRNMPRIEIVQFLPRSLTSLHIADLFDCEGTTIDAVYPLLPPYLSWADLLPLDCDLSKLRPSGFLN